MGRPRVYSDSCQDGTRLPPTTTMRTLLREAYHFYTPLLISINSPELVVVLQRYRDMLYEKGFVTPNKIYLVGQPLFIPGIAMDMNYTPQKMVDSMLQRTPKVQSPYPGAEFVGDPYSNAAFNPSLPQNSILYPPLPQDMPSFPGPPSAFGLPAPGFNMNCYPNIPSSPVL